MAQNLKNHDNIKINIMKTTELSNKLQNLGALILTFMFSVLTFAQETATPTVDVTTTSTKTTSVEEWYTNPIYWVIGALILIVIIAIVARGNNARRD